MRADDDDVLLGRWRGGDPSAGSELVRRHATTVLRFFRRKLECGAEDLTQRTFLAAVEGRDRIETAAGFRAYILGIARYEYIRALRRASRPQLAPGLRTLTSPSGLVRRNEDRGRLLVALRRLPLDLQITLELHYWEEMTTKEIAAVLEVAPGTIKWRLSEARARLARTLASLPAEPRPKGSDDLGRWLSSMRAALESG